MQDLALFYAPDIGDTAVLPDDEVGHILRVLRLEEGDNILVTDGKGLIHRATLCNVNKKVCYINIKDSQTWQPYWHGHITLCVAPTKSTDRLEWLLEKATEIGVNRIVVLKTKHSERKHVKPERLHKVLVSAIKQSQKGLLPELLVDVPFDKALEMSRQSQRLLCHCRPQESNIKAKLSPHQAYQSKQDVAIFIGPEGDFSCQEIALAETEGAVGISLGTSRLRTETAAIVALQWIHTLQSITTTKD